MINFLQNVFSYTTLLLIPSNEVVAHSKNANEKVAEGNISSTHLNESILKTKASAINIEIGPTIQNNLNHAQNNDTHLIIKDDIEMNSSSESSSVDHISNTSSYSVIENLTNSGMPDIYNLNVKLTNYSNQKVKKKTQ